MASLVAQLVKSPLAMWETWVRSLGWEDPREKEMAAHFSIIVWGGYGQRNLAGYSPWVCNRVGHKLSTKQQQYNTYAGIYEVVSLGQISC